MGGAGRWKVYVENKASVILVSMFAVGLVLGTFSRENIYDCRTESEKNLRINEIILSSILG